MIELKKYWWAGAIFLGLVLTDIIFTHTAITFIGVIEHNDIARYFMNISIWLWNFLYFAGACFLLAIFTWIKRTYLAHILSYMLIFVLVRNIEIVVTGSY